MAKLQEENQRLLTALKTLTPADVKKIPNTDPLTVYKQVWDDLSIHTDDKLVLYQCDRIVIPELFSELLQGEPYQIVDPNLNIKQVYFYQCGHTLCS